ncbi:MAG: putative aminohydrolase SsnA [Hydrogenoanaerobacterium sp.]
MLLIGNGRLVTRDETNPFLENGAVLTDGDSITEIGTTAELLAKYPKAEFIDAHGGVIMPGLINAHNHIYSAFARGLTIKGNNPKNFMDILEGLWWTLDRNLTLDDTEYSARATYIDSIKNGVTTVFDHHASYGSTEGSLQRISEVAKEYGVRTCLCYEVSDRDGEEKTKAAVLENEAFINAAAKDKSDMQYGMMGMHAAFTLSDKTLRLCREHTPKDVGFHIHVAEGIDDVYDSLAKYGKRIVNRLYDNDILGSRTIAGHCIHITPAEMDILKQTDTMVVHNPESNMGNAVGCPAVLTMFAKGILMGLGTDGYTNDMLESYKVANILHKHNTCNPNASWGEIPVMLFNNNAIIANRYFKKQLGVLKAGAAADIIITDYDPLTPMNAGNINGHTLFGMNGRSVITTICAGKVLMRDRALTEIDEPSVMAHCREQAAGLADRINAGR